MTVTDIRIESRYSYLERSHRLPRALQFQNPMSILSMFSIARVFAVAHIHKAVHASQVTAKVRNRCLTMSMKLHGNCVCVCAHSYTHTHTATLLQNLVIITCHSSIFFIHTLCGPPATLNIRPCPVIGGSSRVIGQ